MSPSPRSLKKRIGAHLFAAYCGRGAERLRERIAQVRGRQLTYFHQVGDPYSDLVAQRLDAIAQRHGCRYDVELVGTPGPDAAPEPSLLEAYAIKDAVLLARVHGLSYPESARAPSAETRRQVERFIAGAADPRAALARIERARDGLWADDAEGLGPLASESVRAARIERGERRRQRAGHYFGGVIDDGGETFWGIDRLPHLERALGGGASVPPDETRSPLEPSDEPVEVFFSFRSPYSYLAVERIERAGVPWTLRPVLPMVMRGLPVRRDKRMYIVRDTAREARRLGIEFGFGVDPVGVGVERCIAAFSVAPDPVRFAASAFRGIFAESIDVASDAGLSFVAERAGVSMSDVRAAISDEGWRASAESNREDLFALGLWGVPSFHRGDVALWGQDRLRWFDPHV